MNTLSIQIQKEEIPQIHFLKDDVLSSLELRQKRAKDLYKAMYLGNTIHLKVKITFDTEEGMRNVETTVWYASDQYVVLKGSVTIPVKCIREIEF